MNDVFAPDRFSATLYDLLCAINPGIADMELYEFRYALGHLWPEGGWEAVAIEDPAEIERRVNDVTFYRSIQLKPRAGDDIVLDPRIIRLAQTLMAGLVARRYDPAWVTRHFYFDIRGFFFLHRTVYITPDIAEHLGGQPYRCFEPRQRDLARCHEIGYRAFRAANAEIDASFMEAVAKLVAVRPAPVLLAIAGPTAAGKTEIVARLREMFAESGRGCAAIELDNFLTDREPREARGIGSLGKAALHFELFRAALEDISNGKPITTPRYDFVYATSSHDDAGRLRPGQTPIEINPADIVFIEGNAPFLVPEVAPLIGVKVVYLTDDDVRMKRKWRRDIDYRKKYEPTYFRNRFFREQFIMAEGCYLPQMQLCDVLVDTSSAALWTTPEVSAALTQ